jgi:hypothetical protein
MLFSKKRVFWFSVQILSEIFVVLSRIQRDAFLNVRTSLCKLPVILVRFEWKANFFETFFGKSSKRLWKYFQYEPSCPMRTDGQTWRSLIFAFRNFGSAPVRWKRYLSKIRPYYDQISYSDMWLWYNEPTAETSWQAHQNRGVTHLKFTKLFYGATASNGPGSHHYRGFTITQIHQPR